MIMPSTIVNDEIMEQILPETKEEKEQTTPVCDSCGWANCQGLCTNANSNFLLKKAHVIACDLFTP